MSIKKALGFVLKTALIAIVMLITMIVATELALPVEAMEAASQEQAGNVVLLLLIINIVNALLFSLVVTQSRWRGWPLVLGLTFAFYGVQTLIGQIEAIVFLTPLGERFGVGSVPTLTMPMDFITSQFIIGAAQAVVAAPLAILLFGKIKPDKDRSNFALFPQFHLPQWLLKFGAIIVLYELLYFGFGYFVAWKNPAVLAFYQGTDPGSFLAQMKHVATQTPTLIPFQAFRALLWVAFAFPVISMLRHKPWLGALATGLFLSLPMNIPHIVPNPFMPADVRMAHFIETASSNFIFGVLMFWLFHRSHQSLMDFLGRSGKKQDSRIFFSLILLSLLVTGCQGLPFQSQTSTVDDRDSFSSSRTSSDGFFVEWKGYREGYRAGSEAEFDLTIKNKTDQAWSGRYCLQLMARKSPMVITTLEQRPFSLQSGLGFSDTITIQLPRTLEVGAYGLSLVVWRPGGPMVDMVPIQVGETDHPSRLASQKDLDAALEACPHVEGQNTGVDYLMELSKADLAQRLEITPDAVTITDIEATEFPDASLGVPEPGQTYAQVVTPGYIIKMTVGGQTYQYHVADQRVVAVPSPEEEPPPGDITIGGVEARETQITIRGLSSLAEGACINTELWADGTLLAWWPIDECVSIQNGMWEQVILLESNHALQTGVQYMVRAYQPGGPNIVSTFQFDLGAPPSETEPASEK